MLRQSISLHLLHLTVGGDFSVHVTKPVDERHKDEVAMWDHVEAINKKMYRLEH